MSRLRRTTPSSSIASTRRSARRCSSPMTDGALRVLDWEDHEDRMRVLLRRQYGSASSWTDGQRPHPSGCRSNAISPASSWRYPRIPWRTQGTLFQQMVWRALTDIAAGETLSYGALAHRIGKSSAVRAVGLANGANPVSVVVPCHRVIGCRRIADGLWRRARAQALALAARRRARARPSCRSERAQTRRRTARLRQAVSGSPAVARRGARTRNPSSVASSPLVPSRDFAANPPISSK